MRMSADFRVLSTSIKESNTDNVHKAKQSKAWRMECGRLLLHKNFAFPCNFIHPDFSISFPLLPRPKSIIFRTNGLLSFRRKRGQRLVDRAQI